ncbi:hypothetical protein FA95DRAFT_1610449 [Auriscalpium vulgare]|uniref:Uncharacterized protein n=1 Tax=Auriscalpium vulgare TaxID=40419 RepID=A0ACB8RET6_9AGAM|nr:hypothetical protein FA95DRAFT_1610449 [Auriscalpium vulgare]
MEASGAELFDAGRDGSLQLPANYDYNMHPGLRARSEDYVGGRSSRGDDMAIAAFEESSGQYGTMSAAPESYSFDWPSANELSTYALAAGVGALRPRATQSASECVAPHDTIGRAWSMGSSTDESEETSTIDTSMSLASATAGAETATVAAAAADADADAGSAAAHTSALTKIPGTTQNMEQMKGRDMVERAEQKAPSKLRPRTRTAAAKARQVCANTTEDKGWALNGTPSDLGGSWGNIPEPSGSHLGF